MWECGNCKQEIEDKYRHCWNCGNSKTQASPNLSEAKIQVVADGSPSEAGSAPQGKFRSVGTPHEDEILSKYDSLSELKPRSKITGLIPLILWLAAFIAAAGFAYYSDQKMNLFENRITEELRILGTQTNQFAFSKDAPKVKGNIKAKVLPLAAKTGEIDGLYKYLPDDLRPANLDQVKTLLWLDCTSDKVWVYEDGSVGYREKCNAFLVDRSTSKIIEVQNFLGEMPPLTKKRGTTDADGKVLPERYVSYIREAQPETERARERSAADSPNHHYFNKSESLYSIILLFLLGAIGTGWIAYKLKFSDLFGG